MALPNKHSFIFNSKIKKFLFRFLLFVIPVVALYYLLELRLRQINFPEKIKNEFITENKNELEILFFGSSETQRAINPKYLDNMAINLSNSSQRIFEDSILMRHFVPKLPNLKAVVFELSYDRLERDKTYTSPVIDHSNLIFYGINTFNKRMELSNYSLFSSNKVYFARILKRSLSGKNVFHLNKYGFENAGIYPNRHRANLDSLPQEKSILHEVNDKQEFIKNSRIMENAIRYCLEKNLKVIIYIPPTYYPYTNAMRPEIIQRRNKFLKDIMNTYQNIYFYSEENNLNFSSKYYFNFNHLNPLGAKKATRNLNSFLKNSVLN